MSAHPHAHTVDLKAENEKFYAFIYLALFMAVVTGVELLVIYLPLPEWIIFAGVVLLSLVKFFGVIFWFMHLIYDHKLLTLVFCASLAIATGTAIALMFLFHPDDVIPLPKDDLGWVAPARTEAAV